MKKRRLKVSDSLPARDSVYSIGGDRVRVDIRKRTSGADVFLVFRACRCTTKGKPCHGSKECHAPTYVLTIHEGRLAQDSSELARMIEEGTEAVLENYRSYRDQVEGELAEIPDDEEEEHHNG